VAARKTRIAISERFATRILLMAKGLLRTPDLRAPMNSEKMLQRKQKCPAQRAGHPIAEMAVGYSFSK
jgi:hypothetical protein